ncbi:hypothetical protein GCM10022251_07470 [Phytohabitans flavus]|uniref:Uncharacterized protein n=1 Tax=Phytohabitans flavus TaxID=1076124 RepID=A0A6F8Y1W9_9ACTN|nr:hypothetical protein Pflav_064850 [Phytohabitans flavus]
MPASSGASTDAVVVSTEKHAPLAPGSGCAMETDSGAVRPVVGQPPGHRHGPQGVAAECLSSWAHRCAQHPGGKGSASEVKVVSWFCGWARPRAQLDSSRNEDPGWAWTADPAGFTAGCWRPYGDPETWFP